MVTYEQMEGGQSYWQSQTYTAFIKHSETSDLLITDGKLSMKPTDRGREEQYCLCTGYMRDIKEVRTRITLVPACFRASTASEWVASDTSTSFTLTMMSLILKNKII